MKGGYERMTQQSFSHEVKLQLCRADVRKTCCAAAELAAVFLLSPAGFLTAEKACGERLLFLGKKVCGSKLPCFYRINSGKEGSGRRSGKFGVLLNGIPADRLLHSGLLDGQRPEPCCAAAFLRGCFLVSGSVNAPEKAAHLEFHMRGEESLNLCLSCLAVCGLHAGVMLRGNRHVIYMKDSERISAFLAIIGAHKAMLDYETGIVLKEVRNHANRAANCDNANLEKTASACVKQTRLILEAKERGLFDDLPQPLREIAALRLCYPDYNLTELGKMLTPPLSKAGVSHRMKKLEHILHQSI